MRKRRYDGRLRAERAQESAERILAVAERAFATEHFERVTLASVAASAGVTVTTLQRKYGDKQGLFAACAARGRARIVAQRGAPPAEDVRAALAQLVDHYEAEGRLVWHLVRQESDVPTLARVVREGRRTHRAWVETVFADALEGLAKDARRRRSDALVAATDLFVWKLLRVDLGRARADVEGTMFAMASAVARGV